MRWIAAATIGLTLFSAVLVHAQPERVTTQAGPVTVENVATGLVHPWGMDFLPDGRLLVTERPGRLRILQRDGRLSQPLAGTPEVFARGEGGMLDVRFSPTSLSDAPKPNIGLETILLPLDPAADAPRRALALDCLAPDDGRR